jgi:hypothetical protein
MRLDSGDTRKSLCVGTITSYLSSQVNFILNKDIYNNWNKEESRSKLSDVRFLAGADLQQDAAVADILAVQHSLGSVTWYCFHARSRCTHSLSVTGG